MIKKIKEGSATISAYISKKISKELPVFYNPIMKLNRDISVMVLNALEIPSMEIADILAGTGIRSVRFEKEVSGFIINKIHANDNSKTAVEAIKENIKGNRCEKVFVHNKDANLFMIESKGFDYIDIDPFGTPNPFIDSAVKRVSRNGIIAVTATDTSALSGTYPAACRRKYFARPIRNELKHEAGVRILIRKVQLIAAQYGKALIPIFSYSKDHYFRVFFRNKKGKSAVDDIIHNHRFLRFCNRCRRFEFSNTNKGVCCETSMEYAGPMWSGSLFDKELVDKIAEINRKGEDIAFIDIIRKESELDIPFFYDLHSIAKTFKLSYNPKKTDLIKKIKNEGFRAEETHFSGTAIKTDMPHKDFVGIIKQTR